MLQDTVGGAQALGLLSDGKIPLWAGGRGGEGGYWGHPLMLCNPEVKSTTVT